MLRKNFIMDLHFVPLNDHKRFELMPVLILIYCCTLAITWQYIFDALFIWTAECAGCKYFLTIEKKLPKFDLRSKTMLCLQPSELLAIFQKPSPAKPGNGL